jgi:hypothetical protein
LLGETLKEKKLQEKKENHVFYLNYEFISVQNPEQFRKGVATSPLCLE